MPTKKDDKEPTQEEMTREVLGESDGARKRSTKPPIVFGEPVSEAQLKADAEYEQKILRGEVPGEQGAGAPGAIPDEPREGPMKTGGE